MSYTYLLVGENLELAQAELDGFLRSQEISEECVRDGRIAVTDSEPDQLKRLALVHEVGEKLYEGELERFEAQKLGSGSFKVRSELLVDRKIPDIESKVGAIIESDERKVDLESPDMTFKVYVFDNKVVVSRIVEDIDRSLFEDRSNEKRPFSSPVSLDPVLARVLVNLAEVPPGNSILDPFCGTGGILIEAGLCGIGVYGCDISEEMVRGTRKNLQEYGIIVNDIRKSSVEDARDVFDTEFEALITDLPYGKSSKVEGKPVDYFASNWNQMADKAVFCYDKPVLDSMESEFEIYIHKNMSRYIFIQDRS